MVTISDCPNTWTNRAQKAFKHILKWRLYLYRVLKIFKNFKSWDIFFLVAVNFQNIFTDLQAPFCFQVVKWHDWFTHVADDLCSIIGLIWWCFFFCSLRYWWRWWVNYELLKVACVSKGVSVMFHNKPGFSLDLWNKTLFLDRHLRRTDMTRL